MFCSSIIALQMRAGWVGAFYWRGLQHLPVVFGALAAIAMAIYLLYPPQLRSLKPGWRWALPMLRAGALAGLAISWLQPVVSAPKTSAERGAVVLLVDQSKSMSVTDSARPWGEWVAIAAALGKVSPGMRDASAAALQAETDRMVALSDTAIRARSDWDYAKLAGRGETTAKSRLDQIVLQLQTTAKSVLEKTSNLNDVNVLQAVCRQLAEEITDETRPAWLDAVQRRTRAAAVEAERLRAAGDQKLFQDDASVQQACIELSTWSRLQLALEAVSGRQGLANQLGESVPVMAFGFGDRITPFSARQAGVAPVSRPIVADGSVSNLTGAVRSVLDQLADTAVRAVVVLTDGRQVGGDPTVPSGLAVSGVPIYGLRVSSLNGVRDVSVPRMSVPASAFVGETITVRAEVRAMGMGGNPVQADVTLSAGDARQTQHIQMGDEKPVTVEFMQKVMSHGPLKVAVDVSALPGEASVENNHAERWVKVLDQKIRVAAYAGAAGWDYQYVRNALRRTPWAEVKEGILPNEGSLPGTAPATMKAAGVFPLSPQQILQQDVLLLFDVGVDSLDAEQWNAVKRLATQVGGSVILVGGDAHVPGEYLANPVTAALLPFTAPAPVWQTWPGELPAVHLMPAAPAEQGGPLQLGDESTTNEHRWQQLPGLFRFMPMPRLKSNSRPLLVESDSGAAVLTESRTGAGRTFFFGANETWRWRYKVGEREQDRFWLQLIRYAAEEPYAAERKGEGQASVSLDADAVEAAPGEAVHVRARVLGSDGLPVKNGSYRLEVIPEGKAARTIRMAGGGSSGPGRFSASITDLDEGNYTLRLDPRGIPGAGGVEIALRVQKSFEAEMADLSGDNSVLRTMVRASGGELLRLDQMDTLVGKLMDVRGEASQMAERRLWDSPYLFVLVAGCLVTEWALRKRFGLP